VMTRLLHFEQFYRAIPRGGPVLVVDFV